MGERRGVYRILVEKPEGQRPLAKPRPNGMIILRWIFRQWDVSVWTRMGWLRIGTMVGTCGWGNEPSGSIRCGEFLD